MQKKPSFDTPPEDDRNPNAAPMMFLSMFIILLAFFIVLVVLSEIVDQKAEVAIQSVAKVFSAIPRPDSNLVITKQLRNKGLTTEAILKDIERLIRTEIKVTEAIDASGTGQFFFKVPIHEFFERGKAEIREDRIIIFKRVAAQAKDLPGNFHASFVIKTQQMPVLQDFVIEAPLQVQRVANMARRIIAEGLSTRFTEVGLSPGEKEEVEIIFTITAEDFPVIGIEQP